MNNPFNTFQGFANSFQSFMNNPAQYLMQSRLNIPQQYMQSPDDAIQYLMNNGRLNQQTYNRLNSIASQIQNTPMFQNFIGHK